MNAAQKAWQTRRAREGQTSRRRQRMSAHLWASGDRRTTWAHRYVKHFPGGGRILVEIEHVVAVEGVRFNRGAYGPERSKFGSGFREYWTASEFQYSPGDWAHSNGGFQTYYRQESVSKLRAGLRRRGFEREVPMQAELFS